MPEVKPLVDEHRLYQLRCPDCGAVARASLPAEVSASGYGPRLVATVGLLSGSYRQSERQTQQVLEDFYQVEVALGTVNKLWQEVAEAVAEPVVEAAEFAQAQAGRTRVRPAGCKAIGMEPIPQPDNVYYMPLLEPLTGM